MVVSDTQIGMVPDNTTLEKSGNIVSIKDDGVTTAKIKDGEIVDADISSSAGISASKVAGIPIIQQIYESTGLDYSVTGGGASQSLELSVLSSATLTNRTHLKFFLTGQVHVVGTSTPYINLKIEIKEVGGSYGAIFDEKIASINVQANYTWAHIHVLTAGEISNGAQVKITVSSPANGDGAQIFTLNQIMEEII